MRFVPSLLIILIATLGLGRGTNASAQSVPRRECFRRMTETLGFDSQRTEQISAENPITYGRIERITRFSYGEGPWNAGNCAQISERVIPRLYDFVARRFELLLSQGKLDLFFHEYKVSEPFHRNGRALANFTTALPQNLNQRYLELLRQQLATRLLSSPWAHYVNLQFTIDQWSDEWSHAIGAVASAAVDMEERRVALNPFSLPPDELEYFLFHELAHLGHWNGSALLTNERLAWEETVYFIEWRQARGDRIPDAIAGIRRAIREVSSEAWALAALQARGIH